MKKNVWPDAEVAAVVRENYVPLDLDIDDPAASKIATRYGVSAIPTVIRLDSTGKALARGGFMRPAATVKFLAAAAEPPN